MKIKAAVKLLRSVKEPNVLAVHTGESVSVYSNGPLEKLIDLWTGITDMLFARMDKQYCTRLLEDLSSNLEVVAARYMAGAAGGEADDDQSDVSGE